MKHELTNEMLTAIRHVERHGAGAKSCHFCTGTALAHVKSCPIRVFGEWLDEGWRRPSETLRKAAKGRGPDDA